MSRFSALRLYLLRNQYHHNRHRHRSLILLHQQLRPISLSSHISPLINKIPSPSVPVFSLTIPAVASVASPHSTGLRSFSSDSDLPSNMVLVKSEDQLNDCLRKAEDESSPAVFYFTAVWCGPCKFIWPEIKNLSESLPNVMFYKIDIDEMGTRPALSKLNIFSVPTLHFFKNGKKAAEVVGADAKRIKDISSSLYKNDSTE